MTKQNINSKKRTGGVKDVDTTGKLIVKLLFAAVIFSLGGLLFSQQSAHGQTSSSLSAVTQFSGAGFGSGNWQGPNGAVPLGGKAVPANVFSYAWIRATRSPFAISSNCSQNAVLQPDFVSAYSYLSSHNYKIGVFDDLMSFQSMGGPACGATNPTQWGQEQANWLISILKSNNIQVKLVAADIEYIVSSWADNCTYEATFSCSIDTINGFISTIKANGYTPVIYSDPGEWASITGNSSVSPGAPSGNLAGQIKTDKFWLSDITTDNGTGKESLYANGNTIKNKLGYHIISWQYATNTEYNCGTEDPKTSQIYGNPASWSFAKAMIHSSPDSSLGIPAFDMWTTARPDSLCMHVVAVGGNISRSGYWEVTATGSVFENGTAQFYGSPVASGQVLNQTSQEISGFQATYSGHGYLLVAKNGTVYNYGDAHYFGNAPVQTGDTAVGIAVAPKTIGTKTTPGYWVATANGYVYNFGLAKSFGNCLHCNLSQEGLVTAIASTNNNGGYWLATANGYVHNFGDAGNYGSPASSLKSSLNNCANNGMLNGSVIDIVPTGDNKGYFVATSGGDVFAFGDAKCYGVPQPFPKYDPAAGESCGDTPGATTLGDYGNPPSIVIPPCNPSKVKASGFALTSDNKGYWFVDNEGTAPIFPVGDALSEGTWGPNLTNNHFANLWLGTLDPQKPPVLTGPTLNPDPKTTAYVSNYGNSTVTPIDTATNTPGASIPVGQGPGGITMTPNGSTVYVANTISGTVTPINTSNNNPGSQIPVGVRPIALTATPNGSTVYVVNAGSNTVTPISTATNSASQPIDVGNTPVALTVSPNGQYLYVANVLGNSVTVISTLTNQAVRTITGINSPDALAVSPDNSTLYITDYLDGLLYPVNLTNYSIGPSINVGAEPIAIVITPNGTKAYVDDYSGNQVVPINLLTDAADLPIYLNGSPVGLTLSPDGSTLYVADWTANTLDVISTSSDSVETNITVGYEPDDVAMQPSAHTAGYLSLQKTGNDTPFLPLNGAVFNVINSSSQVVGQFNTNPNGSTFNSPLALAPGQYTISEITPPAGYNPAANQVVAISSGQTTNVTFNDQAIAGNLSITQFGNDTPFLPISGAAYEISGVNLPSPLPPGYSQVPAALTAAWNPNCNCGRANLNNLLPGIYQITETIAPFGYNLPKVTTQQIIVQPATLGGSAQVEFNDSYISGSLKIQKYGNDTPFLSTGGAVFELFGPDPSQQDVTMTTVTWNPNCNCADSIVNNLKPGIYSVVEYQPPPGYTNKSSPITTTVEPQSTAQAIFNSADNKAIAGSLTISQFGNDSPILTTKGAVFELTGAGEYGYSPTPQRLIVNCQNSTQICNGATITLNGLLPGNYRITEISPPSGYYLPIPSSQPVTVEPGLNTPVVFTDKAIPANVNVNSYGFHCHNFNNAVIDLIGPVTSPYLRSAQIDESNCIKIPITKCPSDLLAGSSANSQTTTCSIATTEFSDVVPGAYTLIETQVHNGYELHLPINVNVPNQAITPGPIEVELANIKCGVTLPSTTGNGSTLQQSTVAGITCAFADDGMLSIAKFGNDTPFLPVVGTSPVVKYQISSPVLSAPFILQVNSFGNVICISGPVATKPGSPTCQDGILEFLPAMDNGNPATYKVTELTPPPGYSQLPTQNIELCNSTDIAQLGVICPAPITGNPYRVLTLVNPMDQAIPGNLAINVTGNDTPYLPTSNTRFLVTPIFVPSPIPQGYTQVPTTISTNCIENCILSAASLNGLIPGVYEVSLIGYPIGYDGFAVPELITVEPGQTADAQFSLTAILGQIQINDYGDDTPFLQTGGATYSLITPFGTTLGPIESLWDPICNCATAIFSGLLPQIYTVVEDSNSLGYTSLSKTEIRHVQGINGITDIANFNEHYNSGTLNIIQLGNETPSQPVSNATVLVSGLGLPQSGIKVSLNCNLTCNQATASLAGLEPGIYSVTEINAPDGYITWGTSGGDSQQIDIEPNTTGSVTFFGVSYSSLG